MNTRLLLLCVIASTGFGCATIPGKSTQAIVLRAKDKVAPALVHIRPVKEVFTQGKREEIVIQGSGFIITPDGYVITNEHVAGKSTSVRCVLYDKEELEARVVGVDPFTDIALLKLETDRTDLPTVALGTSSDLQAGQSVLALGSPHGLARSVSMGIVSVTDRYLGDGSDNAFPFNNWIQTDAAINPGNSGGPLVNLKGEVIGVNARKLGGADNVGFAIPVDVAREVVEKLRADGRVKRSWIGVSFQETTQMTDSTDQMGVVVSDIEPLSPAQQPMVPVAPGAAAAPDAQAQLRPGDILLAVDGVPTNARFEEDLPAIRKLIADKPIGATITLQVQRGEQVLDIPVVTEERQENFGDEVEMKEWGLTVAEVTPAIARVVQLPRVMGVLVSGAVVGGPGDNAGLQRGDVILKIDEQPVDNLKLFQDLYQSRVASAQRLVLLDIKQGALSRFVILKQEAAAGAIEAAPETQGDPSIAE